KNKLRVATLNTYYLVVEMRMTVRATVQRRRTGFGLRNFLPFPSFSFFSSISSAGQAVRLSVDEQRSVMG
ncbi:hypothetical protein, partial [Vibrio anguillarum]|uniref:hypothetical protein n=1 Tax=Vibrio anguillarum TaxID=55601 RepID=UPI001BE470CD